MVHLNDNKTEALEGTQVLGSSLPAAVPGLAHVKQAAPSKIEDNLLLMICPLFAATLLKLCSSSEVSEDVAELEPKEEASETSVHLQSLLCSAADSLLESMFLPCFQTFRLLGACTET